MRGLWEQSALSGISLGSSGREYGISDIKDTEDVLPARRFCGYPLKEAGIRQNVHPAGKISMSEY